MQLLLSTHAHPYRNVPVKHITGVKFPDESEGGVAIALISLQKDPVLAGINWRNSFCCSIMVLDGWDRGTVGRCFGQK